MVVRECYATSDRHVEHGRFSVATRFGVSENYWTMASTTRGRDCNSSFRKRNNRIVLLPALGTTHQLDRADERRTGELSNLADVDALADRAVAEPSNRFTLVKVHAGVRGLNIAKERAVRMRASCPSAIGGS